MEAVSHTVIHNTEMVNNTYNTNKIVFKIFIFVRLIYLYKL